MWSLCTRFSSPPKAFYMLSILHALDTIIKRRKSPLSSKNMAVNNPFDPKSPQPWFCGHCHAGPRSVEILPKHALNVAENEIQLPLRSSLHGFADTVTLVLKARNLPKHALNVAENEIQLPLRSSLHGFVDTVTLVLKARIPRRHAVIVAENEIQLPSRSSLHLRHGFADTVTTVPKARSSIRYVLTVPDHETQLPLQNLLRNKMSTFTPWSDSEFSSSNNQSYKSKTDPRNQLPPQC